MLEHKPLCAIDLEIMKTCTFLVVAKHSFLRPPVGTYRGWWRVTAPLMDEASRIDGQSPTRIAVRSNGLSDGGKLC